MSRLSKTSLLLVVTSIVGYGCPFDTRDAVPPPGTTPPAECLGSDAITEGAALRGFEQAVACGSNGVDILTDGFAEDLVFVADPFEDQTVQDFFTGWQQLAIPRDGLVAAFSQQMSGVGLDDATLMIDAVQGDEVPAPTGDGVLFENTPYALNFDSGADFAGQADIFVRAEGSVFVIYRWEDAAGTGAVHVGPLPLRRNRRCANG